LIISVRRRVGLRNTPNVATAAAIRVVGEGRAGGFRSEASLRIASRSTGERGSQKVLNEDLMGQASHPILWPLKPLGPTAGCGRPHVRWCGRGNGRNPVTSTRS
jgi:hypothetical protein